MKNYVVSLGVELEGAVPNVIEGLYDDVHYGDVSSLIYNDVKEPEHLEDDEDGTVHFPPRARFSNMLFAAPVIGEWKYWSSELDNVKGWLSVMFTKMKYRGNRTCGFHVHIALNSDFAYTMDSDVRVAGRFWRIFRKEYLRKYGCAGRNSRRYINRMNGTYSAFPFNSRTGLNLGSKSSALVLTSDEYGTIEIRIFPYQKSFREACDTLDWCVNTVNKICDYITRHPSCGKLPDGEIDSLGD